MCVMCGTRRICQAGSTLIAASPQWCHSTAARSLSSRSLAAFGRSLSRWHLSSISPPRLCVVKPTLNLFNFINYLEVLELKSKVLTAFVHPFFLITKTHKATQYGCTSIPSYRRPTTSNRKQSHSIANIKLQKGCRSWLQGRLDAG